MFSLRSSLRLLGKSTKRMFHNRPVKNTSDQVFMKASDYWFVIGALYVSAVVYNWDKINKRDKQLEIKGKRLENMHKELEELKKVGEKE